MKIKFKKIHADAKIPVAATPEAGAYDVFCTEVQVHDNYVVCKTGFATEIPKGYRVICAARSSITKTGWMLANGIGVVDSDYRGEWEFRFVALPKEVEKETDYYGQVDFYKLENYIFPYKAGDRVGQIFLEKIIPMDFSEEELSSSERGEGGFGSTGK